MLNRGIVDRVIPVPDEQAAETARRLAREEAIPGISSAPACGSVAGAGAKDVVSAAGYLTTSEAPSGELGAVARIVVSSRSATFDTG